jgi:hypothetical protein
MESTVGSRRVHELDAERPVATDEVLTPEATQVGASLGEPPSLGRATRLEIHEVRSRGGDVLPEREAADLRRDEAEDLDRLAAVAQLMAGGHLDEAPRGPPPGGHDVADAVEVEPGVVSTVDPGHRHLDRRHLPARVLQEGEPLLEGVSCHAVHVRHDAHQLLDAEAQPALRTAHVVDASRDPTQAGLEVRRAHDAHPAAQAPAPILEDGAAPLDGRGAEGDEHRAGNAELALEEIERRVDVAHALRDREAVVLAAGRAAVRVLVRLTALADAVEAEHHDGLPGAPEALDDGACERKERLLGPAPGGRDHDRRGSRRLSPRVHERPDLLAARARVIDDAQILRPGPAACELARRTQRGKPGSLSQELDPAQQPRESSAWKDRPTALDLRRRLRDRRARLETEPDPAELGRGCAVAYARPAFLVRERTVEEADLQGAVDLLEGLHGDHQAKALRREVRDIRFREQVPAIRERDARGQPSARAGRDAADAIAALRPIDAGGERDLDESLLSLRDARNAEEVGNPPHHDIQEKQRTVILGVEVARAKPHAVRLDALDIGRFGVVLPIPGAKQRESTDSQLFEE